jgi:hypothetical protein
MRREPAKIQMACAILADMASKTEQRTGPPNRVWLFFIAICVNLVGSAMAGLTHSLNAPWLALQATLVWIVWFALLFTIAIPASDKKLDGIAGWLAPLAKTIIVVLGAVTALAVIGLTVVFIMAQAGNDSPVVKSVKHAFEPADAMALTQQATDNLLDGKNPYTSSNIIIALNSSKDAYDKITPLFTGSFSADFPYPTSDQLRTLWEKAVTTPGQVPPEIETHQSYPAGSFILPAPLLALGVPDIRIAYIIIALPALAYAARSIKPGLRIYFVLGVALSLEIWSAVAGGDTSMLAFPFLLLGWILLSRKLWISALCMGIAIATKQVAWYFFPFYLILVLRTGGFKRSFLAALVAAGVFAAFNLPFVVLNPGAWFASVSAPLRDNLFPEGVGLVTLVTSGVLHTTSQTLFTALEGTAMVLGLVWYYRNCRRYPHTAVMLAVLPLFFAWRSNWNYFYYADVVLFAAVLLETRDASPDAHKIENTSRFERS